MIHPQQESYWGNVNPIGPRSCYDESRRFAEAITFAYRRARRVDTRIIRIFNTCGPRMRLNDGRVVPNFIAQSLRGKHLTVYGSGKQTRSFCYADDLIEGVARFMLHQSDGFPVNLGNPSEFTIMQLARLILKISGSTQKIIHKPFPQDDPRQRCPDISRAKKLFGWQPEIPLGDGLTRTIEWFKGSAYNE